jgi:hypothetical protein
VALDLNFAIPGDPAWPLNQVGDRGESWVVCKEVKTNMVGDRCTNLPATDKMLNSSGNTWPRCGKNWRRGYWRGFTRKVEMASRASGG